MNKPNTKFVIVRGPRTDDEGNSITIQVKVVRPDQFDFTDYSFLRMSPNMNVEVEEWVPTKELELYRKYFV
jgi:hypothetical protein